MDWKIKFNSETVKKHPLLLVGDSDVLCAEYKDFVKMQRKIIQAHGWEKVKNGIRGHFLPEINIVAITLSADQEENSIILQKIIEKFPSSTIVSLSESPYVVYGKSVPLNILNKINKIAKNKWNNNFQKEASKGEGLDEKLPYYKDNFLFEISDIDRYTTDKYAANLTLQETDKTYSIGFQINNAQIGIAGATQYWHYSKNKFKEAKSTFNELKNVLHKTLVDIGYHRPPMALIAPMIRSAIFHIDILHRERGIKSSYDFGDYTKFAPDWRETIYGNRYPNILQKIVAFERNDEEAKVIKIEGGNSRSRIFSYKPQQFSNNKIAADLTNLKKLLADVWKITSSAAVTSILSWMAGVGMAPEQLEAQLQRGATPQEVMQQVNPQQKNTNISPKKKNPVFQSIENPGGGRIQNKTPPHPKDIVTVQGYNKKIQLHRVAAQAWENLVQAARNDGLKDPLFLPTSGYRDPSLQKQLWEEAKKKYGSEKEARKWVAPPGNSSHQSGRAIDFYLGEKNNSGNVKKLQNTASYKWLVSNAQHFGFYPYSAEPWHWEYNP